jgi:hypothetical protein
MAEEDEIVQPKLTLGELGIEAVFSKACQDQTKMFDMLFIGFGVDENVIDVNDNELVEIIHEDGVHEPHERRRSIGDTKGHNGILI